MFKRCLQLLLLACLVTTASWAANNPFIGSWKLNPSKSKLTDQMKVESVGGNKYTFDFGGGPESIVVDGTDQTTKLYGGGTLSVAVEGDNWKVIRKKDGRMILSAIWNLSKDGNTLTDHYTGINADGSSYTLKYVYKRKGGGSGFAATWVGAAEEAVNYNFTIQLAPNEGDGLSIVDPSSQFTGNMKFAAAAVHKLDEHMLELMRKKADGELSAILQLKLSPDLKTLSITPHAAAGIEPTVYVFERA